MSLTKRLYRLDEVRSAFLFCLKCRRFNETIFWLKELEDTFLGRDVRRLLLVSWAMNVGLARQEWLKEWCIGSLTAEGRLRLCWQLLRCSERDSSIWYLLWSGVLSLNQDAGLLNKWNSICGDKDFWSKINHRFADSLKHDMKTYEIFSKAIACCLDCTSPKSTWAPMSVEEPIDLVKNIDTWNKLSIRKGRIYEIPYGCLYGMTQRGLGVDTSDEINNFDISVSPYWKRICIDYESDDAKELFFDTHFPDDIPDEWSLTEKRQSHGPGVHCVGPLNKWWSSWICEGHMWIDADIVYNINKWVKEQSSHLSCIQRLCDSYKSKSSV